MDAAILLKDAGTQGRAWTHGRMDTGTLLTPNSRDGSTPFLSNYLAMSEDYLTMTNSDQESHEDYCKRMKEKYGEDWDVDDLYHDPSEDFLIRIPKS